MLIASCRDRQGHELQVGTNCLGHFLLTQLLHPILTRTAATAPTNTVRVAWARSLAIDVTSPSGGVDFDEQGAVKYQSQRTSYGVSKAGNLFLASEFGRRARGEGIVSVVFNPGNLRTELQNTMSTVERYLVVCTSGAVGHRGCLGFFCFLGAQWADGWLVAVAALYGVLPCDIRRLH